jgi:energy-coupling factor transport system permease protein
MIVVSYLLLLLSGTARRALPVIGASSLILITVVIIRRLFSYSNHTPLFSLGPFVFYKEGLLFALNITLRIFSIINAVSMLIFTTRPSDLIEALIKHGLSPRIAYVFSSLLQIIPQMMSTVDTIIDAQRSRGMETEGSLAQRMRAFIPLMVPAVISSLTGTRERALALEVRAFNSRNPKTFLNEGNNYKNAPLLQIAQILVLIAAVVWRIAL